MIGKHRSRPAPELTVTRTGQDGISLAALPARGPGHRYPSKLARRDGQPPGQVTRFGTTT